jgi:uncharacterized membrane protein
MAGIGFELRKLLRKDSLLGLVQAYAYAGVIGSGPWILSILGILMIGLLGASLQAPGGEVTRFQVSVTWLIASSLILTGGVQLAFTRYVSDRLFESRDGLIVPNLHGVLCLVLGGAGLLGLLLAATIFDGTTLRYRLLMVGGFTALCGIWVLTIFLSGLKRYRAILAMYALGYGITVAAALALHRWGLEGLLAGFLLGHFVLLGGMWWLTVRSFALTEAIRFDFLQPGRLYPSLLAIGVLYNLGVWMDKLVFWLTPATSEVIVGPLRASLIYDLPVFMAYLFIIPGMAVFLVRIETDFVEYHQRFYDAVRSGGTLEHIEAMRDEMVLAVCQGFAEIAKIQTLALLGAIVVGPAVLASLGIPELYLPLFHVQTLGASLQVGVLALLNVFFYLDQRRLVLRLCLILCAANALFTLASLQLGAAFYGYGYVAALLLTLLTGLFQLDRRLGRLEYETFMLR